MPHQVFNVAAAAGGEVIRADDAVAIVQKSFAQMRSQKAGAARHEHVSRQGSDSHFRQIRSRNPDFTHKSTSSGGRESPVAISGVERSKRLRLI